MDRVDRYELERENREMKRIIAVLVIRLGGQVRLDDIDLVGGATISTRRDEFHGGLYVTAER